MKDQPTRKQCFVFYDDHILLSHEHKRLTQAEVIQLSLPIERMLPLEGGRTIAYALAGKPDLPKTFIWVNLRRAFELLSQEDVKTASKAVQLLHWDKTHQHCGSCGTETIDHADDTAKTCPSCAFVMYPRISPSIIVLVKRGDKILLARGPHFPPGRYSVLAGFVEPGESAEDTLHREIKEEVGIEVENVVYKGSQSWPFPHSLMLGFEADYKSGDIHIDGKEIEAADWFSPDNLPDMPTKTSIAHWLIDDFLKAHII